MPDVETARLMTQFYTQFRPGVSKLDALRGAQLSLLKDPRTRHPRFWAGFTLTGDIQ